MRSTRVWTRLGCVFAALKLAQALVILFVPSQFDISSRLLLEKYTAQKAALVSFHTASPRLNSILASASRWIIEQYFEKLVTWDAVYFGDLFVNDPQYEHQFVFCPLWWRMVRWIPVDEKTAFYSRFILATLLANTFHFLAALVLYYYTHATFKSARIFSSRRMAMAASVLFICSPAAAFMTAPYSEPAAAFFSFACLYMREVSTQAIAAKQMGEILGGSSERESLESQLSTLSDSALSKSSLSKSSLSKSSLSKSSLSKSSLSKSSLSKSALSNSTLSNSTLSNSTLSNSTLSNSTLIESTLSNSASSKSTHSNPSSSHAKCTYTHDPRLVCSHYPGLYMASGVFAAVAFGLRANCLLIGLVYVYDLCVLGNVPKKLPLAAGSVLGAAFAVAQVHGYVSVCHGTGRGEWCDSMVPSLFAYAQAHYWNNGFLKYWTLGNVPNFGFAAPTVLISVLSVRYFAYMYPVARVVPVLVVNVTYVFLQCLFWHVQIVTRVHTFLPIVYWTVAGLATQRNGQGRRWASVALAYFAVWNLGQVALFAAFLPPA